MEREFLVYTIGWLICTVIAGAFLWRTRSDQVLFHRSYWGFLCRPWKVVTFLISGTGVTFLGPLTIDSTWDWVDGGFMSIMAFSTAPWAVGTFYRAFVGWDRRSNLIPATVIWLFSASWSYDIYLYWRDGFYPPTWWPNLILSSVLYFSAGMFWNLDWEPDKGAFFSFRERQWPATSSNGTFSKIIWIALPFMGIAIWLTLGFLKILHQ